MLKPQNHHAVNSIENSILYDNHHNIGEVLKLLTHINQINQQLPASDLSIFISRRFYQLSEDTDIPPNLILVETNDDISGPPYAFIGNRGLLSDLFDEHEPGHPEFARPYEWASYLPALHIYEALLLINGEDGYLILIPEAVVETHPDLKWVLTDEHQGGLSQSQSL